MEHSSFVEQKEQAEQGIITVLERNTSSALISGKYLRIKSLENSPKENLLSGWYILKEG